MITPFLDRRDAGRRLAAKLAAWAGAPGLLVLGLPRGGVPVAYEVARALGAPLDVCTARKLGAPGHEEFAIGAIAGGGVVVLHQETIRELGVSDAAIARVRAAEEAELARREALYRQGRPPLDVAGRTVIVVDDGLATGATMQAVVQALRAQRPAALVVAAPVASSQAAALLAPVADQCVFVAVPQDFMAVGAWYRDFGQTEDAEVHDLLARAARERPELGDATGGAPPHRDARDIAHGGTA
jgi:predicted phosphoribosyltransferase